MAMYNTKLNYNGEPCTWRHVSTVRGQALGNLPQKCGKASSAEPTDSIPPYPQTLKVFTQKPPVDFYVSAGRNLRFPFGKHTAPHRETYGSRQGNIENVKTYSP